VYRSSGVVYNGTNTFVLDKAVDVIGSGATLIDGGHAMRCAYVVTGGVYDLTFQNGLAAGAGVFGRGGGLLCEALGHAERCILVGNEAAQGGAAFAEGGGRIYSSLVVSNSAEYGGGVAVREGGRLWNLTIADNSAQYLGGGVYCNNGGDLYNCVICHNTAPAYSNCYNGGSGMSYVHCCSVPDPGGIGCIDDDPEFMPDGYEIGEASPCRDAGTNDTWMYGARDLWGNNRISFGTVDIGACEFIPEPGLLMPLLVVLLRGRARCPRATGSNGRAPTTGKAGSGSEP
jgi:hypothetical protein